MFYVWFKFWFVEHVVRTDQSIKKVFWLLFLKKVTARRAGEILPFFFLQSFFFWGYFFKRKSVKGVLLSIDSATNYSNCLSFIHFFFAKIGTTRTPKTRLRSFRGTPARKSSQKEMPSKGCDGNPQSSHSFASGNPYAPLTAPLRVGRHFWKSGQNNWLVRANIVRDKSKFVGKKTPDVGREFNYLFEITPY